MSNAAPIIAGYQRHLLLCVNWLFASMHRDGGSRAHFSPAGWSRQYPETTGYIAATLINCAGRLDLDDHTADAATRMIEWLLSIQSAEGWWHGGLHPPAKGAGPSVFNTGQILNGLMAAARSDLCIGTRAGEAAAKAAHWLAGGIGANGEWTGGHYRGHQPDYYSFVTWPMLDFAEWSSDSRVRAQAEKAVDRILANRLPNGALRYWSFDPGKAAFTHTICYTIQGLQESARLLARDDVHEAVAPALERLRRSAELSNGALPGAFDLEWKADRSFECLTGSAQLAICLLLENQRRPDLRLVNAAAKLVDRVCALQRTGPGPALRGAVAGSRPLWGPYMRLRYPNWAVKFHADALMMLMDAADG